MANLHAQREMADRNALYAGHPMPAEQWMAGVPAPEFCLGGARDLEYVVVAQFLHDGPCVICALFNIVKSIEIVIEDFLVICCSPLSFQHRH